MSGISKAFTTFKDAITGTHHQTEEHMPQNLLSRSVTTASGEKFKQEKLNTSNMAKILIIGETGSGKSTFINYLTNYFLKGNLENLKIAIPSKFRQQSIKSFNHCEHDIQNTTQSKTDGCNQYMFTKDSKHYVFLDTPGLSDTRGAEQDNINITKIINSVEYLGGLTAVIIVVNGTVPRITINLENVITRLRGNLPDTVMDNVIVVLTNTTRYVANFSVPALELKGNVYPYYMQNSAFSTDPSTWNAAALEALQVDWNQAMDELDAMIETLDTFKTKSVAAFTNMRDIRNEIKTLMHAAQLEVSQIQKMQDEISAFDAALKQTNIDLVTYKDYTKERTVEKTELVDAPYHSTLCQNCTHVCHPRCGLDEATTVGAQIFQNCWAMSNGKCRQCPNECSYTDHYHAKKIVQKTNKKLQDVLVEIKTKYDKASNDQTSYKQKINTTADVKNVLEKALNQKKDEIINLCRKLRAICSGFNLAQELHSLINQLELQSSMLRNIDAKQQATVLIRSLKEFCTTLEKEQETTKTLPTMNIINTSRSGDRQSGTSHSGLTSLSTPVSNSDKQGSKFSLSPPDSDSHANEDVLAAVRALSDKKTKVKKSNEKNKKPSKTVKTKVDDTESSDISTVEEENENPMTSDTTESEIENNESAQKKSRKKKKKNKKISESINTADIADQYKELTVDELLARYRTCKDKRLSNFIIDELTQRSYGKSTGPLKTPVSIVEFTSSMQKYSARNSAELRQDYEKLKDRVTTITIPDILKIEQVPPNLLLETAAVYMLLQRTPLETNPPPSYWSTQRDNQFNEQHGHQPYNFSVPNYSSPPPTYVNCVPHFVPERFSSTTSTPGTYQYTPWLYNPLTDVEQPPYHSPRLDSNRCYFHSSASHVHYPRYTLHPQETYSRRAHCGSMVDMSSYNMQRSEFQPINHPIHVRPEFISSSELADSFDDMSLSRSSTTDNEYRRNYLQTLDNRQRSSTTSNSVFEKPNRSSSNNTSNPSYELMSSDGENTSTTEVRSMIDTELLSAYYNALTQRNRAHRNIIYNEFKRRCSGDHPIMIREKKVLFEKKCNNYQGRSHDELKQAQTDILLKIKQHLVDDNPIHLKKVPFELIVEAAALAHFIGYKAIDSPEYF